MKTSIVLKINSFFIRLRHWEYWPAYIIWLPVLILYVAKNAFKLKHPFYYTAVNPGIWSGGLGIESKFDTLHKVPGRYRPQSILIKKNTSKENIRIKFDSSGLEFPLIIKPNVGFRGLLVKKIYSLEEMNSYILKYPVDFIVQEFIEYKEEFGVFYYRYPNQEKGNVSSITIKEFLNVIGNGKSSIKELIENKPRALLQLDRLEESMEDRMNEIPEEGEIIQLGEVGNHAKGTIFKNGNYLINDEIVEFFNKLSAQIEGFYYGRFDIRCDSSEDLKTGNKLKIIEINGICAEPTHIYDPSPGNSYWKAVKTIGRYQKIAYEISMFNHKMGTPFMPVAKVIREARKLKRYTNFISRCGFVDGH